MGTTFDHSTGRITLTGDHAIQFIEMQDASLTLSKYADPVEGARTDVPVSDAEAVIAEDPSLIYVSVGNDTVDAETYALALAFIGR